MHVNIAHREKELVFTEKQGAQAGSEGARTTGWKKAGDLGPRLNIWPPLSHPLLSRQRDFVLLTTTADSGPPAEHLSCLSESVQLCGALLLALMVQWRKGRL